LFDVLFCFLALVALEVVLFICAADVPNDRFSSDYYLSVSALVEDCEAVAAEPEGHAVSAVLGACMACEAEAAVVCGGSNPALLHEVAAAVVGRIVGGALLVVAQNSARERGRHIKSTANDDGSFVETNAVHCACAPADEDVSRDEAAAAPAADSCLVEQVASVDLSASSYPQAVSYPLTPRRLVALKDRTELVSDSFV
jgi:hypothetical protein